uniref:Uncharacterized protein n=1 Tax=Anguilla anguilla TaxID=7936 RepID=A0A0E9WQV5_ANGAN
MQFKRVRRTTSGKKDNSTDILHNNIVQLHKCIPFASIYTFLKKRCCIKVYLHWRGKKRQNTPYSPF